MSPSSSSGPEGTLFAPIADAEAVCAVRLPTFEGPLDLLLHLIRQNELDITDLPMARIAEQYLEYLELMHELRIEVAADYLVMAATLAWIKSRMLLPVEAEATDEEEPDPRAELVARLLEYQRFQEAARELGGRSLLGRDVFTAPGLELEPRPPGERTLEVGLFALLDAMRRALREAEASGTAHTVLGDPITVRDRMMATLAALEQAETVLLDELLQAPDGGPPSRGLVIATFLAILELARIAALRIYQSVGHSGAPEGPVRLRRASRGEEGRAESAGATRP